MVGGYKNMENNKPVISKEKFVEYINFIKSLDKKESSLQKGLEECFGRENVGYLFVFNEVVPKMIEMLCDLMGIEYNATQHIGDDIQYFIYELDFGENKCAKSAVEEDGVTYDLSSPEKLYDYIVKESSEKE